MRRKDSSMSDTMTLAARQAGGQRMLYIVLLTVCVFSLCHLCISESSPN